MEKAILNARVREINILLKQFLPAADSHNQELARAMEYSVQAGGKRLRPMLMQETFRLFAGEKAEPEILHCFMAGIEFIHTYSLIHDDLPAMDNDDYRRGQLTTHKKYGEAAGILTGDALLNYAYEVVFRGLNGCSDPGETAKGIQAAIVLSEKAGMFGMVGGQYIDVYSEKNPDFRVEADSLEYIYKNKTSALLEASMMIGAILGGAQKVEIEQIEVMARQVGMAFQIRDDILDITGDQSVLGKPVGSDERNEKQTYVSIYGLDAAQEAVRSYSDKALEILAGLHVTNEFLKELIIELINREK